MEVEDEVYLEKAQHPATICTHSQQCNAGRDPKLEKKTIATQVNEQDNDRRWSKEERFLLQQDGNRASTNTLSCALTHPWTGNIRVGRQVRLTKRIGG